MFPLMMRNVARSGVVYSDPAPPNHPSAGWMRARLAVLSARPAVRKQNYVNNWTRDSAITMMEITAQGGLHGPSALDRVRCIAEKDKGARFTALLHHVDVDRLRAALSPSVIVHPSQMQGLWPAHISL
jgi:hypothetical protein